MSGNDNTKKTKDNQCDLCKSVIKNWKGSDIKCAFTTGVFNTDNWNCQTMNALRENKDYIYSEDQHLATLPIDASFIVLSWYKRRGRVEGAWFVSEDIMTPLTIEMALEYLQANNR